MLLALPPCQYHHQHRQQCQRGYFNLPLVPTTGAKSSYSYWHHRPHAGRPAITPLRMLGQQLHYHCCQATTSIVTTIASTSLSIRGVIPPFAAGAINSIGASTSTILTACRAKPLAPPLLLGPSTIVTGPLAIATGPLTIAARLIPLSQPANAGTSNTISSANILHCCGCWC